MAIFQEKIQSISNLSTSEQSMKRFKVLPMGIEQIRGTKTVLNIILETVFEIQKLSKSFLIFNFIVFFIFILGGLETLSGHLRRFVIYYNGSKSALVKSRQVL